MNELACDIARHEFKSLFIEVLGWDHASGEVSVSLDEGRIDLTIIAQKRGLQVLHGTTDHFTLINRGRLRRFQRKLAAVIHEHIVIYSCSSPRKQVWQWAIRLDDGRRLRHREHPFFSESPPPRLVARLKRLRFTPEEEEGVTLIDALWRAREVLDSAAEQNLFVHRPWYAERSDQLARAVESGGEAELHEFLAFHRPLVTWAVRPFQHLYGGSLEDAEQAGIPGLIHAARHFKRDRGTQFSTYAIHCIRGFCKRDAASWLSLIRVPQHVIWPCLKLQRVLERVSATGGPQAVRAYLDELQNREPALVDEWAQFEKLLDIRSLSQRQEPEYGEARNLPATQPESCADLASCERRQRVREFVGSLKPRDAEFVRLKHGFDGEDQTLEQIGQSYEITRERVRQRLVKAYERLRFLLAPLVGHPSEGNGNEPAMEVGATTGQNGNHERVDAPGLSKNGQRLAAEGVQQRWRAATGAIESRQLPSGTMNECGTTR